MHLTPPSRLSVAMALFAGLCGAPAMAQDGLAGAYLAARTAAANYDFRAADVWFRRAEVIEPFHPELLQGQMVSALSLGDLPRAAALADSLVSIAGPDSTTFLAQIAALAQAKDFAGISKALEGGGSLGPLLDQLVKGWAHIGQGQMNDGIAQFDSLIAQPGLAGFGLYHKAIALALAGDLDGAATAMQAPEAAGARTSRRGAVFLAEVLSQLGRNADAIAAAQQVPGANQDAQMIAIINRLEQGETLPLSGFQDAASGLAESFFSLAAALSSDSDADYALVQARIAATLRPGDTEAVLMVAGLLERLKNFDLAAESYAQVPPEDPDYAMAEVGRAEAVYSAGRKEDSLQILRDLAAARPDDADVQIALGNGLRREEMHQEAIGVYDRVIAQLPKVGPEHWALFYSRAISLEASGDFPRAEADFRRALELNPDQPNVLNYLGYSLVDRGLKLDEALGMIERAVAARPDSGYIIDSLAWALYRLGRYDEALAPMERAALLEPVDPIVTDHLGDVYWANGRQREAQFQWRRALSFNPTEKDAERIRLKLEVGLDEVRRREGAPPFPNADKGGL